MRSVEVHPAPLVLRITADQRKRAEDWLTRELADASSAREPQERLWRESMRLYEGIPKRPKRDFPIPNAPNLTVPLAAIATDAVYSQMLDLIYSMDPVITVRASHGPSDDPQTASRRVKQAAILQRWIDHSIERRYNLRPAVEDVLMDICLLGTGFLYSPYERRLKRTRVTKVVEESPRIYAIPPEDVFVPGGARSGIDDPTWISLRFLVPEWRLEDRIRHEGLKAGMVEEQPGTNWVRSAREALGRTHGTIQRQVKMYELLDFYVRYDIDDDGEAEDLFIVFDRTSGSVLKIDYNPFDFRPLSKATYQRRAHLFYGIGVPEMLRMKQEAATEVLNHWLLNMLLANTRIIVTTPEALAEGAKIWPNKIIRTRSPQDIQMLQMADVYSSGPAALNIVMGLAERRVGINELSTPRPSQILGSRTPGITALTLAQQTSRRFTAPFDSARNCIGQAVTQCVYREQEQIKAGNQVLAGEMDRVLGTSDAALLHDLLRDPHFDEFVSVELTASSVTGNREADKQNALLLFDRIIPFYERALQLQQLIETPGLPPGTQELAKQIGTKAVELLRRVLQNFSQIRDPERLLVEFNEELDKGVDTQAADPTGQGSEFLGNLFGLLERQANGGTPPDSQGF